MPNVLGMFNEAKQNTFVTEVQKYIDTAKAQFTNDAFKNQGKTIYYSSEYNDDLKTSKLDMDGSKEYFIEMDRHGEFKRLVIYDNNFCYDVYSDNTNGKVSGTKSKKISDIDKTSIIKDDIWESGEDKLNISISGTQYVVVGCKGDKTVTGETSNVVLEKVKIDGVLYDFIPGMTWGEWFNSEYNKMDGLYIHYDTFRKNDGGLTVSLRYTTLFGKQGDTYLYGDVSVMPDHQIVKNEVYHTYDITWSAASWDPDSGLAYYESGIPVVYNMERKILN